NVKVFSQNPKPHPKWITRNTIGKIGKALRARFRCTIPADTVITVNKYAVATAKNQGVPPGTPIAIAAKPTMLATNSAGMNWRVRIDCGYRLSIAAFHQPYRKYCRASPANSARAMYLETINGSNVTGC